MKKRKAAELGPDDKLPVANVKRMWAAGRNLTDIAQAIGTSQRPNGTGYRIGRIRNLSIAKRYACRSSPPTS